MAILGFIYLSLVKHKEGSNEILLMNLDVQSNTN